MAADQNRIELGETMAELIGNRMGAVLMEHLPPHRWDELATKDELSEGFTEVDRRFEQVDKRFEQVDKRFEQVDKRFEQVDKRFEHVDRRFDRVDERLTSIEHTLAGLDDRFDASEARLRAHVSDGLRDVSREINSQTRLLFFGMTGAIFTSASLAFAAVRF